MNKKEIQNRELSIVAAIAAILLCFAFGSNAVAIKIGFRGLGVFTTAALRFTLASCAILLWLIITKRSLKVGMGQIGHYIVLSIGFIVQFAVWYYGIEKTYASRSMLIANLQPFFVLFLSHFFIAGDQMTKRKFFGILFGFIGIAFVFMEREVLGADFRIGDLCVLISTIIWACQMVYIKRILHICGPFLIVFYPMVVSLPFFYCAGFFFDDKMIFNMSVPVVGSLLYQGLVTASFGMIAWNMMLQRYGNVALHSFVFILPVAGVTLGGLILREPITYKIITALLFIICGSLVVNYNGLKQSLHFLKRS